MCTVSFVPIGKTDFVLTSNRDEAPGRETLPPAAYITSESTLVYPKDMLAGGTWIGASDKGRLICLLNGGLAVHERTPPYRISRGVVVQDFLQAVEIKDTMQAYDLSNVEPFTIVAVSYNTGLQLIEFVWTGTDRRITQLPITEKHIWSSSTLYTEAMKSMRKQWFAADEAKLKTPEDILHFHKTAGTGDAQTDVLMNRSYVQSVSITQVSRIQEVAQMRYEDLQKGEVHTLVINKVLSEV